ncbi:hypothetical protein CDD80_3218 [Ophiocordyceps camponoti-rufipedis]|uniref:aminomethyltransferase n=1 Tax=Ophiocordyceps camponoti-rufipedis TaxID=2004952 RepID=A0A2C5Z368_9HYPO|nr:hypothetical protein CDD80_3218 [Ophiocordyceps camponoti-rufipedis]
MRTGIRSLVRAAVRLPRAPAARFSVTARVLTDGESKVKGGEALKVNGGSKLAGVQATVENPTTAEVPGTDEASKPVDENPATAENSTTTEPAEPAEPAMPADWDRRYDFIELEELDEPMGQRRGYNYGQHQGHRTPLYDFHIRHEADLVAYANHKLPIMYPKYGTITQSHFTTRINASFWDVSHMVQHIVQGDEAAKCLELLTPGAWRTAPLMRAKLTTFLWPTGGIVDDAVVTKLAEDKFYIVTNGATREKIMEYLREQLADVRKSEKEGDGGLDWTIADRKALLALQGPDSQSIISNLLPEDETRVDLDKLYFGDAFFSKLHIENDVRTPYDILITRGGYTGEDGFELSFAFGNDEARNIGYNVAGRVADSLMRSDPDGMVLPSGLGTRDTLRLEAGLCLYGQDLDDKTTPVEAGLGWVVSPERRVSGGFLGADVIIPQLTPKSKGGAGVWRRRIGMVAESGRPARHGAKIYHKGREVGAVTSGIPSPSLQVNIAMGYVEDGLHKVGTELEVDVRKRMEKVTVVKMPFIETRYRRPDGDRQPGSVPWAEPQTPE